MVDTSHTKAIARHWSEHQYYEQAEALMARFWGQGSPFGRMFDELLPGRVVDLACGRGRHAAVVVDRVENLVLIDVNETNIEACRRRFSDNAKVTCLVNKGYDIPLDDASVDSIFSFDAMVHFEYDAVLSYIAEAYRVLKPGGRALMHYSNYDAAPGHPWEKNPMLRNFMSEALFCHAARRRGFEILGSQQMDWGSGETLRRNIDALTLLEKR